MDNQTESRVIEMYLNGIPMRQILKSTGIKSRQTIYNVLNRNGVDTRRNTLPDTLPEQEIVELYTRGGETEASLANRFGCSAATISNILNNHLSAETIKQQRARSLSRAMKKRMDAMTKEQRKKLARHASSFLAPQAQREAQQKAAKSAGDYWRGKKHKQDTIEKMRGPRPHTSGNKSHLWKGGVSAYQWRKPNWREQRKKARERDNNTCQACSTTAKEQGQNMDVHHIIPYREFDNPKEANQLSNLICLCRVCHLRVENGLLECPTPTRRS